MSDYQRLWEKLLVLLANEQGYMEFTAWNRDERMMLDRIRTWMRELEQTGTVINEKRKNAQPK